MTRKHSWEELAARTQTGTMNRASRRALKAEMRIVERDKERLPPELIEEAIRQEANAVTEKVIQQSNFRIRMAPVSDEELRRHAEFDAQRSRVKAMQVAAVLCSLVLLAAVIAAIVFAPWEHP